MLTCPVMTAALNEKLKNPKTNMNKTCFKCSQQIW